MCNLIRGISPLFHVRRLLSNRPRESYAIVRACAAHIFAYICALEVHRKGKFTIMYAYFALTTL